MVFRNNPKDNFIESAAAQEPLFLNSRNNCKEMYQYNIYAQIVEDKASNSLI